MPPPSYISPEARVPADHPLRQVRALVRDVLKELSRTFGKLYLRTLEGQSLRNACTQIYADSIAASSSPESYPDTLIERHVRDPISGQKRIEFYGSPSAWTNQFKSGLQYVWKFRTPGSGWRQD
jgi:hypothetical protein